MVKDFPEGYEEINQFLKNVGKAQKRRYTKHENLRSFLWDKPVPIDDKKLIAKLKYPLSFVNTQEKPDVQFDDLEVRRFKVYILYLFCTQSGLLAKQGIDLNYTK